MSGEGLKQDRDADLEKKRGIEDILFTESSIGDIIEEFEEINRAFDEKNFGELINHLLLFAQKLEKVTPKVAPIIGALGEEYGSAFKPLLDQLVVLYIKAVNYGYVKAAEIMKETISAVEEYEKIKARHYAVKFQALKERGFSREETMAIILAEITKSSSSPLENIVDKIPKKRK